MSHKDISQARNPDQRASLAAMQRAARMAREIAIQTNTAIILHQDGRLVRITADQLRAEDQIRKKAPASPLRALGRQE